MEELLELMAQADGRIKFFPGYTGYIEVFRFKERWFVDAVNNDFRSVRLYAGDSFPAALDAVRIKIIKGD